MTLVTVALVAALLLAVVAVKALHRTAFGRPDAAALGVLGAIAGATIAWLAYAESGQLVALESLPYAALCALAGPQGC